MVKTVNVKEVCYCYASSPLATKLGFGKTGCYAFLYSTKPVKGFDTKEQAFELAESEEFKSVPYSTYSLKP